MKAGTWLPLLALVAGVLVLLWLLQAATLPIAELDESRLMGLVYLLCWLALAGGASSLPSRASGVALRSTP